VFGAVKLYALRRPRRGDDHLADTDVRHPPPKYLLGIREPGHQDAWQKLGRRLGAKEPAKRGVIKRQRLVDFTERGE
jgi:hypothetical protein